MSNDLNPYRQNQARFVRMQALEQQSQPRGARPNGTAQNSCPTPHQSHHLYAVQPLTQAQAQSQSHAQPQLQSHQATRLHDTRPNDNFLYRFLHDQQQRINASLTRSDKWLEILVSSVSSMRETADGLTKKLEAHDRILEKLEQSSRGDDKAKAKEIDVMKVLVGEMKAFKKSLGKSCDGDEGRTVLGRLDAVTFAVGELLERARDPEANLPKPNTSTVSPIIDLTMSLSPSPPPAQSQTYADVGTSPVPSPPPNAQPPKKIAGLGGPAHKDDRPADRHNAVPLNATPGPRSGIPTFQQPYTSTASTSSAKPTVTPTPFIQTEAQRQADKTLAALRASIGRLKNPYLGAVDSSVREEQQKEQSQRQGLPEPLEAPQPTRDDEMLSVDNVNSERLTVGADGMVHIDEKIRPMKRALDKEEGNDKREKTKRTGKRDFELDGRRNGDLPAVTASGLIDLTQHLRGRHRSSSSPRFVSPSTSLSSLSGRGRTGSRLSIDSSESISVSSTLSHNSKLYFPTKTEAWVGAGASRSPRPVVHAATAPPTTPAAASLVAASVTTINSTSITVTPPVERAASVASSQSALRPTVNAGLVTVAPTVRAASPATITNPAIFPSKIFTPAASESSHLEASAAAIFNNPGPLSRVSILPAATSSITASPEIAVIPTKKSTPAASSRLDPLPSPAAIFNKPPRSQASSNATADEISVSKMVIDGENGDGEGEGENLAEKTGEKIELKMTKRIFEKEEEEEEEEEDKRGDRFPLSTPPSLSLSPPLLSSIPGSPHPRQPSVPSTPRPQSDLSCNLLPHSPLVSSTAKNQTHTGKTLEANADSSFSSLSFLTCTPQPQPQLQSQSQTKNAHLVPPLPPPARFAHVRTLSDARPDSSPPPRLVVVMSSPAAMNLEDDQSDQRRSQGRSQDEGVVEKLVEGNDEDETDELDLSLEEQEHHDPLEPQSPLFSSPSVTNNISLEKREEEEEEEEKEERSEEGVALNLKSPMSSRRRQFIVLGPSDEGGGTDAATIATPSKAAAASTSSQIPTQGRASIETLLSRDLSPLSDVEEKGGVKEIDKTQVSDTSLMKRYTSLGDDADIVRVKKRKVFEGSGLAPEKAGLVAKEKKIAKNEEVDISEVHSGKTGADVDVKKPSRLNLTAGKKGDGAAVTRVKKRKVSSGFVIGGEGGGEGDELDQERPLKRARQRVSERQMRMEPLEKGKRLTRESSGSSFGVGTSTRVSKPRSSASASASKGSSSVRRHGKVEVEWPKMTQGDRSEDLVECNKCKSWYHYGCVGITAGDACLQSGKKYFCPPCKAETTIKKLNTNSECCRPGCIIPAGYIVEKIIGRYKKFVGGQGLQFKYLLRWKGYNLSESSWEPEESMYDPPFMIDKFRLDALEEGIDIDKDKTGLILLRVAKDPCVRKPM